MRRLAPVLFAAALPSTAHAGGLFLPGVGPTATQRAGAFVASADDPSALGVNPAGLAKTDGIVVLVGANFVDYDMTFTRAGTYDDAPGVDLAWEGDPYAPISNQAATPVGFAGFQAVPMISVAIDLEEQVRGLHVAAGLVAPTAFPNRDYDSAWTINEENGGRPPPPSRYDSVRQEAAVVMPSVAAGYRINEQLDVGGRFTWGVAELDATTFVWGEQNYAEYTGSDAVFHVEAKDRFVPGFGLGALYRPSDAIELGLSWDSALHVRAKGTGSSVAGEALEIGGEPVVIGPPNDDMARCAPGGVEGALKACVNLTVPMVTTVGGRYILRDAAGLERGDVELDVAWERWSTASDTNVIVDGVALGSLPLNESDIRHNFRDVFSVRLGGSYRAPVGAGLVVRAGLAHDTAAARPGWERVDMDGAARTTLAAGVAYPAGKVTIQAGGGIVHEGTREVTTDCNPMDTGEGCDEDGTEEPINDRVGPDPIQPLNAGNAFQSPFNAGRYESGYVLFNVSVIARF